MQPRLAILGIKISCIAWVTGKLGDTIRQRSNQRPESTGGDSFRVRRAFLRFSVKVTTVRDCVAEVTQRYSKLARHGYRYGPSRLAAMHMLMRIDVGGIAFQQRSELRQLPICFSRDLLWVLSGNDLVQGCPFAIAEGPFAKVQ